MFRSVLSKGEVLTLLCQNCQTKDAAVHFKQIINGEAVELHLCPDCARTMGYSDLPGIFQASFDMLFGSSSSKTGISDRRCPTCGLTFGDISHTGLPGCPDCYKVFGDKLMPSVRRLHGRAVFMGKIPESAGREAKNDRKIKELISQLNDAVSQQNYERAAFLRDEIKALRKDGDD